MKTKKAKKKGLLVYPDDLKIGEHYAVVGLKRSPNQPVGIAGQAFELTAINLPFLVGKLAGDPSPSPVTLDVRFLNFMRVSPEYVQAQKPEATEVP